MSHYMDLEPVNKIVSLAIPKQDPWWAPKEDLHIVACFSLTKYIKYDKFEKMMPTRFILFFRRVRTVLGSQKLRLVAYVMGFALFQH